MKEENDGELAFLDNLLKQNNGKISVLVYMKPTDTNQYQSIVSCLFTRAYSIITSQDDLTKENARIKQVLKENVYR